jgi:hypothetical protein
MAEVSHRTADFLCWTYFPAALDLLTPSMCLLTPLSVMRSNFCNLGRVLHQGKKEYA